MTYERALFMLSGGNNGLIVRADLGDLPEIVYLGPKLAVTDSVEQIPRMTKRFAGYGMTRDVLPITLSCEPGVGLMDSCGLHIHRAGSDWAPRLIVKNVVQRNGRLDVLCSDPVCKVEVAYAIRMHQETGLVSVRTEIRNTGTEFLSIDWAATLCLSLPKEMSEILSVTGRWANEFQTHRDSLPQPSWISDSRRGRTSHNKFPGAVFCAVSTNESQGHCLGVHLGWSGNHRMRVDQIEDGRAVLQMGELLLPGEVMLAAGETYETPAAYLQFSADGLSDMSAGFHEFYRDEMEDRRVAANPRPVHYNTWEAVYFAQDEDLLHSLASKAAEIGVERFVLDDGWFTGRRSDRAGLGDWQVDWAIFPDGLMPLIEHVRSLGMEFGLWVEPEMVNEDSDLFRSHPDWVLSVPSAAEIAFRNQRVINLTIEDAFDHVFRKIDVLLGGYDISYLKWDMNRDLNLPGGRHGKPTVAEQTRAVYRLLDKLRRTHPDVEIESCASGGGRADFGVLARTDRIWTSDSNDAIDRQLIQRGASLFFPLSILGSHVGPKHCHVTGRTISMHMRAATAMMGHMGVEADLLRMSVEERIELAEAITLYKRLRETLHSGQLVRLDSPPHESNIGVISRDKTHAIFSHAKLASEPTLSPARLKFRDLKLESNYLVRVIWPTIKISPPPHNLEKTGLLDDGIVATGEALCVIGLQMPQLFPASCLIFELTAVPR